MTNIPPDHSEGPGYAYRAYLIGSNGRIEMSVTVPGPRDDKAIQQARELSSSYEVELWD